MIFIFLILELYDRKIQYQYKNYSNLSNINEISKYFNNILQIKLLFYL